MAEFPSSSNHAVRRYYRWTAPVYDATRWLVLLDRNRAVRSLGIRSGDSVLEIGTGTGFNLPALVRAVGPRGRITGLDFSPHMLERAARRVRNNGWTNVHLLCADAAAFGLRTDYDAVLFSYSLSMIAHRDRALDRAVAHLRPGGRLGVVDFGRLSGWGGLGRMVRRWLALNHVRLRDDELRAVAQRVREMEVILRHGTYNFIAVGTR